MMIHGYISLYITIISIYMSLPTPTKDFAVLILICIYISSLIQNDGYSKDPAPVTQKDDIQMKFFQKFLKC